MSLQCLERMLVYTLYFAVVELLFCHVHDQFHTTTRKGILAAFMISKFRAFKINLSNEADDNNRRVTNTCRYQNCMEKGEQAMLRRQHSGVQHSGNYYDEFEGIQKPAAQATNQQRGKAKGSRLPSKSNSGF